MDVFNSFPFEELKTMLQTNPFHKLKISALGSVSAPTCLGLAERTFGKNSQEYRSVLNFTKEKRAGFIASIRGFVVGFIVYDNRHREKAEILAFAVHKQDRRQGIGRQLMGRGAKGPREEVTIKVDDRLLNAHLFLRSLGFRAVEIEHGQSTRYVFKRAKDIATSMKQETSTTLQLCGGTTHETVY